MPVCRALCEPDEFEGLVQRNLAANAGMDFAQFSDFISFIAQSQLDALKAIDRSDDSTAGQLSRGRRAMHIFNLVHARDTLQQLQQRCFELHIDRLESTQQGYLAGIEQLLKELDAAPWLQPDALDGL